MPFLFSRITILSVLLDFKSLLIRSYNKSQCNQGEYTRISPFLLLPLLGCNMFTY
ncbi:hypothetical protein HanIR_Chr02g0051941 [Helianthus annuus]|nr:hypothetical protein HanIR_Chr02g0051941 [Helianthus annuus]